jgi:hypothetical protein
MVVIRLPVAPAIAFRQPVTVGYMFIVFDQLESLFVEHPKVNRSQNEDWSESLTKSILGVETCGETGQKGMKTAVPIA